MTWQNKVIKVQRLRANKVMPSYRNLIGKRAYLMNIYTDTDFRRRGIACNILDLLIKETHNRESFDISLDATSMGRPMYEKYGFVSVESEMELSNLKNRSWRNEHI